MAVTRRKRARSNSKEEKSIALKGEAREKSGDAQNIQHVNGKVSHSNQQSTSVTVYQEGGKELVSAVRLPAPVIKLTGHTEAVNGVRFSNCGSYLASCGQDSKVLLWNVFHEQNSNYGMLEGHENSVTEVCWSRDGDQLLSCSADKSLIWWDAKTGGNIRVLKTHKSFVNCCGVSEWTVASGSDDRTVRVGDIRCSRKEFAILKHDFEVTSLDFPPNSCEQPLLFTGSVDGKIRAWDLRKNDIYMEIGDGRVSGVITGLSSGPQHNLLSISTDGRVCEWDVRPYVKGGDTSRFLNCLNSGENTYPIPNRGLLMLRCRISSPGDWFSAGSCDGRVPIWGSADKSLLNNLAGHTAAVTDVDFHSAQKIVASCSYDKSIIVGEFQ